MSHGNLTKCNSFCLNFNLKWTGLLNEKKRGSLCWMGRRDQKWKPQNKNFFWKPREILYLKTTILFFSLSCCFEQISEAAFLSTCVGARESVFHASVHLTTWYSLTKLYLSTHALIICDNFHLVLHLYWILFSSRNMYSILIMQLTFPVCCCALLIRQSFIHTHVDFCWFVCYSHVAPTVSYKWNKDVLDFKLILPVFWYATQFCLNFAFMTKMQNFYLQNTQLRHFISCLTFLSCCHLIWTKH